MSTPTSGEAAFAKQFGVDADTLASARVVFNTLASLPWPEPERISLLTRLARGVPADVGKELAARALAVAPLVGFDELMPVFGLAEKRVIGLMRALANVDVASLSPAASGLRDAWATVAALRYENAVLRAELARAQAKLHTLGPADAAPATMRLAEVASSVSDQIGSADGILRSRRSGLRLGSIDIRLQASATMVGDDLALDFDAPAASSAVALSFVTGGSGGAATADREVPDVRGYTALLARRKLETQGFSATLSAVAGGRGVVAEQSPTAGTLASSGSVVRLLLR